MINERNMMIKKLSVRNVVFLPRGRSARMKINAIVLSSRNTMLKAVKNKGGTSLRVDGTVA
jgi:hypothetical protein